MSDEARTLGDALTWFDRKERRLVVGMALGKAADTLDPDFCDRIAQAAKIQCLPPQETRWFTDYHLDWLAGALRVYAYGEETCLRERLENAGGEKRLVHGNQQDIDLLLVRGTDLVMIEAKWFGAWDNKQLEGKLQRLARLRAYASEMCDEARVAQVRMNFLVMSPMEPPVRIKAIWDMHGAGGELGWLPMPAPAGRTTALVVTRCTTEGKSHAEGTHWRVKRIGMPGSAGAG